MRRPELAERYAQALYGAARARSAVDAVAADVEALIGVVEHDPALRVFISSPQVTEEHKHELVDRLFGKVAKPLTVNFLHLLLHKRRSDYLEDVLRAFVRIMEEHRGVLRARVTVARPLEREQETRLQAALERRTGSTVVLETRVDPAIIGGVTVQLGDQILDDSVRSRLAEIREALLTAQA